MSVICHTRYDAKHFSWDAKVPAAELSQLQGKFNPYTIFSQVWDDACDEGCVLVNSKTGNEAVFYVEGVDYADPQREDVAGWRLKPIKETVRKFPKLAGKEILIIND